MKRSTKWLNKAVAGMIVTAMGLAITATAQNSALYLDNDSLYHVGRQVLDGMSFNVTTINSADSLPSKLATGTWDIVVIEQYDLVIPTNAALALKSYVANGGAVVFNYWDMNGINNGSGGATVTSAPILRSAFGVQSAITFTAPKNVQAWQTSHPIFTTPNAISGLSTSDVTYWDSNGDRMEAGPSDSAQALAGFTGSYNFEQAAIVEANNGRTIYNGFIFDNMIIADGMRLLENEIFYAIKPMTRHIYASNGTYCDRIDVLWLSSGATQYELFRSTNSAGPFISLGVFPGSVRNYSDVNALPGTPYYYKVDAVNAFGSRGASSASQGWRRSVENHAVGDYDGDGKADPAVYDAATGILGVRLSGAGYYPVRTTLNGLGHAGDVMASADYDGDGKADPTMYNSNTGDWRIMLSSAGYFTIETTLNYLGGYPYYSAMGADFDGDQRADPFVYVEAVGWWRFMMSGDNYVTCESQFWNIGGIGWSMAWADYDGDGLADPIMYKETTGIWVLLLSGRNYSPTSDTFNGLGGLGFVPVIADYDGDGKADPAVFNPATGEWRIMMSASGYARVTVILTF